MEEKQSKITEHHIKKARENIEYEAVYKGLKILPIQCKAVALACIKDYKKKKNGDNSTLKTVYGEYQNICASKGITSLTRRRVADLLNDLGYLGMISGTVTYKTQH